MHTRFLRAARAAAILALVLASSTSLAWATSGLPRLGEPTPRLARPLSAEEGAQRIALTLAGGDRGPLVRGRRAVLEALYVHGGLPAVAEVRVDGHGPRSTRLLADGTLRLDFERPLELDADGLGGHLELGSGGPLPPATAVLRFGSLGVTGGPLGLRRFTGFESGELGEFGKVSGAVSVQSNVVRSGTQAMRAQAQPGQYAYATLFETKSSGFVGSTSLDIDELYVGFQFRIADWSQRVRFAEVGGVSGATKLLVELEPDGRVSLEEDGLTRRYGTSVLERDRWYRIELIVGTGTSTRLQLMIDGQVELDVDDADTSNELTRRVHLGRTSSSGGASDFYYDDVVVSESAHAGDVRVVMLAPDGQGAYGEWSGAGAGGLDDWPHDADATHAQSSGVGALTLALEDGAAAGLSGQVLGVKALAVQRRTGSSFTSSRLRLRSGGVDHDSPSGDAGSGYRLRTATFAEDPTTGSAWQLDALDGLEVGLLHASSQSGLDTRVTAVGAEVLFAAGEPPTLPEIGLRQFTGFETGDTAEFRKTVGTVSVQSAVVRSGGHALRAQAPAGQYAYATLFAHKDSGFGFTSLGVDELHLGFQFRVADWSSRVRFAEISGTSGTTKLRLELEPDGVISVKDSAGTRFYGTAPLELDRWYRLELTLGSGTATTLRLAVDGQVQIDRADADTSVNPTRRVHLGRSSSSGGACDFFYDDVVLSEDEHAGDARVVLLTPNGAGAYGQWSGAGSSGLDDWPHDGDATHAQSNGPGAITCALDNGGPAGVSGRIVGLKALAVQRRTTSSFTRSSLRLRSFGLDLDGPSSDGGASYRLRAHLYERDPFQDAPWEAAALDELELGAVQVQSQAGQDTRVTALGAAVLFVP